MKKHIPLRQKSKLKKKNQDNMIKLMKNSISIGNESNPINNIDSENLYEAKGVIVSFSNKLGFHQKQTLKYAIQVGECLYKIQ